MKRATLCQPKAARTNFFSQVSIGCRYDSNVDSFTIVSTYRNDFALL